MVSFKFTGTAILAIICVQTALALPEPGTHLKVRAILQKRVDASHAVQNHAAAAMHAGGSANTSAHPLPPPPQQHAAHPNPHNNPHIAIMNTALGIANQYSALARTHAANGNHAGQMTQTVGYHGQMKNYHNAAFEAYAHNPTAVAYHTVESNAHTASEHAANGVFHHVNGDHATADYHYGQATRSRNTAVTGHREPLGNITPGHNA